MATPPAIAEIFRNFLRPPVLRPLFDGVEHALAQESSTFAQSDKVELLHFLAFLLEFTRQEETWHYRLRPYMKRPPAEQEGEEFPDVKEHSVFSR